MLTVKTASGSTYRFDNESMTWERRNSNAGHEAIKTFSETGDIIDLPDHSGVLNAPVEPRVGERLTFFCREYDWVVTTPVVAVESD